MKTLYKYFAVLTLLLGVTNRVFAQLTRLTPIESDNIEISPTPTPIPLNPLPPKSLNTFKKGDFIASNTLSVTQIGNSTSCCNGLILDFGYIGQSGRFETGGGSNSQGNLNIGYTGLLFPSDFQRQAALEAHQAEQLRIEAAWDRWYDRQFTLAEEEIENYLGEDFSNLKSAQHNYFRSIELPQIRHQAKSEVPKFKKKVQEKQGIRNRCLGNIKILNLRAEEINAGNINNSRYGAFKIGSLFISDIKSTSQINELKSKEIETFSDNQWRLEQETTILNKLENEFSNLQDRHHPILQRAEDLHMHQYNNYGYDIDKLDLMSVFLLGKRNPSWSIIRGESPNVWNPNYSPYNDFVQSYVSGVLYPYNGERFNYVESYVWPNNSPYLSIFHDEFWNSKIKRQPWNINHWLQEKERAQAEALNNALAQLNLNEVIGGAAAIAGLGSRNEDYINNRPLLRAELENYFKLNDYSKLSSDCANYLLNQYLGGGQFTLGENYYASAGTPEFNSLFNPNIALGTNLNTIAKRDEFTYLNNVLAALLNDNVHRPEYKGQIIRDVFQANGINIPGGMDNATIANYFNFAPTGIDNMRIDHARGHGVKSNLDQYLKDLKAFHEDVQDMLQNAPTGINSLAYVDYENRIAEVLNFTNDDGAMAIADMFTNEIARNNFLQLEHHQAITNSAHDILETGFAEGLEFRKLDAEGLRIVTHEAAEISAIDDIAEDVGQNSGSFWPQNSEEWSAFAEIMAPLLGEVLLAFVPGSDIIGLFDSIQNSDVLGASLAMSGLIIDALGFRAIRGAIKGARIFRKAMIISRKLGRFLSAAGKAAKKGFQTTLDGFGNLVLKKGDDVIAQGDDVVKRFLKKFDNYSVTKFDNYVKNIKTRNPAGNANDPRRIFQEKVAGTREFEITGNNSKIWADGLDRSTGTVLEAKHIGNPGASPFIPGSSAPQFIRDQVVGQVRDEFRRYAAVIADPNNPLTKLDLVTNNAAAKEFFEGLLREFKIPGQVIIKP